MIVQNLDMAKEMLAQRVYDLKDSGERSNADMSYDTNHADE